MRDSKKPTVFISYSHKDKEWKDSFKPHLKALVLEGVFELWDYRKIDTWGEWYPKIQEAMARANIHEANCYIRYTRLTSTKATKKKQKTISQTQ